ncbi:unnamed protein product [Brachionus calyciflorus]|uniref:ABC1 atypical kinase-like domain-containing protein n=1 Tax=Brachionus calyciflorus TaxID=104777 RepID=A0A813N4H8_9BILA|nr:unnamed protein product [Brachionus calyciflorus]
MLTKHLIKNSNRFLSTNNVKPKKLPRFLIGSSILAGGSLLYYEYKLTPHEKRKVRINVESVGRALRSFSIGLKIAFDYKWNLWGINEDSDEYNKNIKECHQRAADRLVDICIKNGGLYVKLGQGLSTMNHILPKEFYTTMRKLQSEALRSKGTDIDELFKEEFNKLPNEIFKEFDYKPLAAASLAQVHKAVDFDGNEIAVKLQYIDLQDRFVGDVFTCRAILEMIGILFEKFNFSWVLDELKDTLAKELDFINEANNSKRCFEDLKNLKFVHVPKVFDYLTTSKILCMEFINGVKISEVDEIKKMGLNLKEVDEKLVKMFAKQIFHTGFVHADPHHGNIYVRKKAGTKNEAEIVLLDHGLYDTINESDRKNLCKLWKYIILKDENKMRYYSSQLKVDEKYFMIFSGFIAMRPLHRPIHDKFIFNSDWVKMSEKEREAAIKEGKFRLPSVKEFKSMSKEELKEWREKFRPFIEELKENILHVFQQFPKGLLLVFRNLNTVRSIIHDHGNLVDRHTIMARVAISGAYRDQMKLGLQSKIKAWFEIKAFDLILAYDSFTRWIFTKYLLLMVKFGRFQNEFFNEINQTMSSDDYH